MRLLVVGYGIITSSLIPHFQRGGFDTYLLSRHLRSAPIEAVSLTSTLDDLKELRPDAILSCAESDAVSRNLWLDRRMVTYLESSKTLALEMSTLSYQWALEWHSILSQTSAIAVECPFTGSRDGAEAGELSVFLNGGSSDPRLSQILDTISKTRYVFEQPGNPTLFKLLYNAWGAAILVSLAEFAPKMRQLGEDFETALRIVKSDGWMSRVASSKADAMLRGGDETVHFALSHMVKDLEYASRVLVEDDYFALVRRLFVDAQRASTPGDDYTAVVRAIIDA